jgi:NADH:ubiquinone oxidoreductase subunit 4 (subunit M)
MGFVTMGIFSLNLLGVQGSLFIMLSHGFVSSGLFFCIGVLYDRHHTRLIKYYTEAEAEYNTLVAKRITEKEHLKNI